MLFKTTPTVFAQLRRGLFVSKKSARCPANVLSLRCIRLTIAAHSAVYSVLDKVPVFCDSLPPFFNGYATSIQHAETIHHGYKNQRNERIRAQKG